MGFEVAEELVGEAFCKHLQVQRSSINLTLKLVAECLISSLKKGKARGLIMAGYWNEG